MSTSPGTSPNDDLIRREDHGPVAVLRLNRPDKRNALSQALIAGLSDRLDRLAVEPGVRVLILTGNGPAFCAGLDLREALGKPGPVESETRAVAETKALAHLIDQVHRFPKPTIAALNGDAYAGGAGIALACDLVVAAEGAKVGYPEVRRGLVAAIVMHDLIRQVGERRARELLLTGAPIGSADALRWGLINRVVPGDRLMDEAHVLANALTQGGPIALQTTKRLVDEVTDRPADLMGPAAITAAVRVSDEAAEGMAAFLEKRSPRWAT